MGSVELTVSPADGLADDVPAVIARGLLPDEPVTVAVRVTDAAGVRWESVNTYLADSRGVMDCATTAPDQGTYRGMDAAGPWWSMTPAARHAPPAAFAACDDRLTWTVDCRPAGSGPGRRREVVRRWRAPHVTRSDTVLDGLRHVTYSPGGSGEPLPVVVLVPGAGGVEQVAPAAALLASRCGVTATVLGYAGGPGQPSSLREVAVERLGRGIAAAAGGTSATPPRTAVVAYADGTAGALTALALEEIPVRAVVAVSPTHVVWQALAAGGPPPQTSAWSHLGEPLPYVPVRSERLLPELAAHALLRHLPGGRDQPAAVRTLAAYAAGLHDHAAVGAAVIPVERIAAPLMAVAGTADETWPAQAMARALIDRHHASPHAHEGPDGDVLLVNRGAGHALPAPLVPTADGHGTPSADAAAQRAAWTAMTRFLRRHLNRP